MLKKHLLRIGLSVLLVFTALSLLSHVSAKEEGSLPIVNTELKTVAIFKNGLGFFIRGGKAELKDGWAVTECVPNATLGSIWIAVMDKDAELEEVIGYREEIEEKLEVITVDELLKANIGKSVIVTFGDKTIEGVISSVPEDREAEEERRVRYDYRSSYIPPRAQPKAASLIVIKTKDGEVALNRHNISKVEFHQTFSTELPRKEEAKRIKFKVNTRKRNAKIGLSYLQKGISWVPSYLVNIENSEKARITLKATVINDVEDIENADIFFVVGYPNFVYADVLSPMALEESITQFIAALEAGGRRREGYGRLANIMWQSVAFEEERGTARLDYGYAAIKGLPGAAEEDLFLYNKKGITLKKGERAYYHIFSDEVPYRHVYEWEIPDTINVDVRGYQRSGEGRKEKEQVWHSVKLTNSTNYPWTTAPAFVISGWKPLSQDTINYTPKGMKTNLKMTVATDISTDRHEYEIDRLREVRMYHRSYDLVTVKGELYIKNSKTKDVTMEIKKNLTGEVIEASDNGRVEKIAEGLQGVNHKSVITWEIPIKAGEEKNITYTYKIYIAH